LLAQKYIGAVAASGCGEQTPLLSGQTDEGLPNEAKTLPEQTSENGILGAVVGVEKVFETSRFANALLLASCGRNGWPA
jgi:hypothetical protein